MKNKKLNNLIVEFFQLVLNLALICLCIILSYLLTIELIDFIKFIFSEEHATFHVFLEKILIFFLYFEFVALIIKYFKDNYHFPLRYFMYIGITAMIRLIIIDHESASRTLLFSIAILMLTLSYILIKFSSKFMKES